MKRFTKKPGRRGESRPQPRLTVAQHEAYRRLILGGGRASRGRLQAWAKALEETLAGADRIDGDTYKWIANRTRTFRSLPSGVEAGTMTFEDAAKIYRAAVRARDPALPSAYDWQMAVAEQVPEVGWYAYKGGKKERPFTPVLLPPAYVPQLAEEIAALVVVKDRNGKRRVVGEQIERYLHEKLAPTDPTVLPWNYAAVWAIEQVVAHIMFTHFYRGRFGARTPERDSAVNEIAPDVARELRHTLLDTAPDAFKSLFDRLRARVDSARQAAERKS